MSSKGGEAGGSTQPGRTRAEWTTLIGSCFVLALVASLVISQLVGTRMPAAPKAVVGEVTTVQGQHHVAVEVTNEGHDTAANVQVSLGYVLDAEKVETDQTIDFLAGGEEAHLVYVVDPAVPADQLQVAATGFTDP
jgi:uncharacterized protein (TIGR02588 family)